MPWTFAHPAAVLPFRRIVGRQLPLLGLVVGSMAPDMGYFAGQYAVATFLFLFGPLHFVSIGATAETDHPKKLIFPNPPANTRMIKLQIYSQS